MPLIRRRSRPAPTKYEPLKVSGLFALMRNPDQDPDDAEWPDDLDGPYDATNVVIQEDGSTLIESETGYDLPHVYAFTKIEGDLVTDETGHVFRVVPWSTS